MNNVGWRSVCIRPCEGAGRISPASARPVQLSRNRAGRIFVVAMGVRPKVLEPCPDRQEGSLTWAVHLHGEAKEGQSHHALRYDMPRQAAVRYGRRLPPFVQPRATLFQRGCGRIQRPSSVSAGHRPIEIRCLVSRAVLGVTPAQRPRMPGFACILSETVAASGVSLRPFRDERAFEPRRSGPSFEGTLRRDVAQGHAERDP